LCVCTHTRFMCVYTHARGGEKESEEARERATVRGDSVRVCDVCVCV